MLKFRKWQKPGSPDFQISKFLEIPAVQTAIISRSLTHIAYSCVVLSDSKICLDLSTICVEFSEIWKYGILE